MKDVPNHGRASLPLSDLFIIGLLYAIIVGFRGVFAADSIRREGG